MSPLRAAAAAPENERESARVCVCVCESFVQNRASVDFSVFARSLKYRDAELPFQLYNVPEMNAISRKWGGDVDYLRRKLGKTTKYKSEASNPGAPRPSF